VSASVDPSADPTVPLPRENIAGHVQRLQWFRKHLRPSDHTLELGCGTGYMITLPMRTWGYDVVGIDLDDASVQMGRGLLARNGLDPDALQTADLRDLDETYDAIIASEVLEHLTEDDLRSVLAAIHERLRPGGMLLVTVPNGYGWFELEAALWFRTGVDRFYRRRRVNRVVSGVHHVLTRGYVDAAFPSTVANSPHRQRFTYRSIRRLLASSGFDIEDTRGSVLIAGPFSQLLFTGFGPSMRINATLGRRLPPMAAGFYVAARASRRDPVVWPGRSPAAERALVCLFRRFPPHETIFKPSDARAAEEYHDEKRFPFYRFFARGPELFSDKDVLDLGSGFGGRPVAYLEHGAARVTGIEIANEPVERAREFAAHMRAADATFAVGTGEEIPSDDDSFDLITMNDVMEHVVSPERVLAECWRVLRPGGRLALVFPPYFDVTAGSHLSGYATSVPGLNALFSTSTLKRAATVVLEEREAPHWRNFLRDVPSDELWNMNGLTVREFKRLVERSPFQIERRSYIGHLDHRLSDRRGLALALRMPAFLLAELPAQLPLVQELCCARICCLLRK
jgi:2-polyprenyl-3-methyl-5-hydroxy-6-metoxy-1,4-benzoquinol methylase